MGVSKNWSNFVAQKHSSFLIIFLEPLIQLRFICEDAASSRLIRRRGHWLYQHTQIGFRTPLSALFRKNSHEKLQTVLETWRPFLIGETEDVRIQPSTIYLDLAQLINQGGLQCSMSVLAAYMFTHSNLSRSENALYVQLKRYKKLSE